MCIIDLLVAFDCSSRVSSVNKSVLVMYYLFQHLFLPCLLMLFLLRIFLSVAHTITNSKIHFIIDKRKFVEEHSWNSNIWNDFAVIVWCVNSVNCLAPASGNSASRRVESHLLAVFMKGQVVSIGLTF